MSEESDDTQPTIVVSDSHPIFEIDWEDPLPLVPEVGPEGYPLEALPAVIRDAVAEVQSYTKAPMAMVASSALAAVSLAVQAKVDVQRGQRLQGPSGLYMLTIADSGERKSTCDTFFLRMVRDYEIRQQEQAQPEISDYRAAMEVWEAKYAGTKNKIRKLYEAGKPAEQQEATLHELEHSKPQRPRVPRLLYSDATPEALLWTLSKEWPSGGIASSEAGTVFGSHGMGKDSAMRFLAALNQLWDGSEIAIERRTSESFTVRGARLTMALQVQSSTLSEFMERSGQLARGTGFLARFLIACPESTQGTRLYTEAPEHWPALEKFEQRLTDILESDVPINQDGTLSPAVLTLDDAAKDAWIGFHDSIERQLGAKGDLRPVGDVASKAADNVARMAALFHVFEDCQGSEIGPASIESAASVVHWHLNESSRFFSCFSQPPEKNDATRLDQWLLKYCNEMDAMSITRRDLMRKVTPSRLRDGAVFGAALCELSDANRIHILVDGTTQEICINPALLEEEEEEE